MRYDCESAKGDLANSVGINTTYPGSRVPPVDRAIRRIKEYIRIRVTYRSPHTSFTVTGKFLRYLVLWCVEALDYCPSSNTPDAPSAYEQFNNRMLDIEIGLWAGFLDWVVANQRKNDLTHSSVTQLSGLARFVIAQSHDSQGNVSVYPMDGTNHTRQIYTDHDTAASLKKNEPKDRAKPNESSGSKTKSEKQKEDSNGKKRSGRTVKSNQFYTYYVVATTEICLALERH